MYNSSSSQNNVSSKFSKDVVNNYKKTFNKTLGTKYHADLHDLISEKAIKREDERLAGIQRHVNRLSKSNNDTQLSNNLNGYLESKTNNIATNYPNTKPNNINLESFTPSLDTIQEEPSLMFSSKNISISNSENINLQNTIEDNQDNLQINSLFKSLKNSLLINSNEQQKKSLYNLCKKHEVDNLCQPELENYCKGKIINTDNDYLLCGYQDGNTCNAGYENKNINIPLPIKSIKVNNLKGYLESKTNNNLSGYLESNNKCNDDVYIIPSYLSKKINTLDVLNVLCPNLTKKTLLLVHLNSLQDPIINVLINSNYHHVKFFNNLGYDITTTVIKPVPLSLNSTSNNSKSEKMKWILILILVVIVFFFIFVYSNF
jgi:hypothetical protein